MTVESEKWKSGRLSGKFTPVVPGSKEVFDVFNAKLYVNCDGNDKYGELLPLGNPNTLIVNKITNLGTATMELGEVIRFVGDEKLIICPNGGLAEESVIFFHEPFKKR